MLSETKTQKVKKWVVRRLLSELSRIKTQMLNRQKIWEKSCKTYIHIYTYSEAQHPVHRHCRKRTGKIEGRKQERRFPRVEDSTLQTE